MHIHNGTGLAARGWGAGKQEFLVLDGHAVSAFGSENVLEMGDGDG